MKTKSNSQEYIKGTLKTIILKLLADHKRLYGYEISQLVEQRTQQTEQSTNLAVWVLMASWVIGIVDSYRVGRALERPEQSSGAKKT